MHITSPKRTYRFASFISLIILSALGIFSRIFPLGNILWDKYLGDVIYAGVFYFILCFLVDRKSIQLKAFFAAIYVTIIELFQLTPFPLRLIQSSNFLVKLFAYVVLGSTFSWWDLLSYAIGIGFAVIYDKAVLEKFG